MAEKVATDSTMFFNRVGLDGKRSLAVPNVTIVPKHSLEEIAAALQRANDILAGEDERT